MDLPLRYPTRRLLFAVCALATLVPAAAWAQATWVARVPPERLLNWRPRTAEEAAHPEVLFDRSPARAAAVLVLPKAVASGSDYAWSEVGPPARAAHVLVYDSRRHRMLLLGGLGQQDPAGSVWSYDLPAGPWTRIATLSWPTTYYASAVAGAVYDSLRDQLLVVPSGSSLNLEALSLGGAPTWSHLWSGPSVPNGFAGLAIDTHRDAVEFLAVWDPALSVHRLVSVPIDNPASWTSVATLGAQPQIPDRGGAVYDAANDVFDVLVNTGYLGGPEDARLFAINASGSPSWAPLALPNFPGTPFPDGAPTTLSLDAAHGRLVVTNEYGDALALSMLGSPVQWLTAPGTDETRYAGASAFDPVARQLYRNGGSVGGGLTMARSPGRLFVHATVDSGASYLAGSPAPGTVAAWLSDGPAPPPPAGLGSDSLPRARFGQFSVVDPVHNLLIWYGGQATDGTGDLLGDLWTLSLAPGGHWTRIVDAGLTPGPRRFGACVYDPSRARFVLMGGDDLHVQLLDAWELRLSGVATWRQLSQDGPIPPYPALYPDAPLSCWWGVTYGLSPIRRVTMDADAVHYEQVDPTGPDLPPTYYYSMDLVGFDPAHHRFMWFPQPYFAYSTYFDQFVTTDLAGLSAAWQTHATSGVLPGQRAFFSTSFDAAASRLVVHGGEQDNGVYYADTWALQLPIDLATATLVSLIGADVGPTRVHLAWNVNVPLGTPCTVERSADGVSWLTAGTPTWTGANTLEFSDAPLATSAREAYRLRVAATGGDQLSMVTWLDGPGTGFALAISPVSNPSRGAPSMRLAMGTSARARLRMLDVTGRVISETNLPAGTREWTAGAAPPPGLYFAELVQAGQRRVARIVVTP